MAEIDSLEIKLQSNIQAVTKDLEQLIGKITLTSKAISAFGNNKALEQLNREAKGVADGMKQAASASGAMKNVSSAASAAQKPMEQLRKSVDETAKELYAKFENFTPVINFSQSADSLKKLSETYQDNMVKAQNELNRIMASSSADKQVKGMERYIIRIKEAENGIKAINDYLDRMSNKPATGEPVIRGAADMEDEKRSLKSFEEEYRNFEAMFKAGGVETEGGTFLPTRSVEMGLEQLRTLYPQAKSLIASYEDLFNRLTQMESGVKFGGALAEIPEQLKIADNPQDAFKPLTEEVSEFQKTLDSIRPLEFSGNFFEMERWVDGLNQRFMSLTNRIEKLNELGVNPDTQRLHALQYDLQTVSVTLNKYEAELDKARQAGQLDIKIPSIDSQINRVQGSFNKLQNTMRGAKVVIPTDSLKKVEAEIEKVKKKYDQTVESINRKAQTVQFYGTSTDYKNKMIELEALRNKYQELINKQSQLSKIGGGGLTFNTKGVTDSVKNLQKALEPLHRTLQKVNKFINSFAKKIASIVSPMKKASKATDGFGKSLSMNFRTILKYGFGIRSLFVLFNRLRAAITEGMTNLIQYSAATNRSLSMLKSSLNQTKNSLAAAFAPIINAIAPAVNYLIQLLIKAINVINQFFAAITGQSTWIRAKYVYEDMASGISGVGSSAEDAAKKIKGSLQSFDALNNLTTQDNADAGGGGGGSILPEDMFETLPINDKIKEFADKVKDILKRLFAPLKKAWDREGKFVMDSWEKALKNVWALIKDIGRDFLRVWEQEATVDVLANILHIIGDIGLVVSNLAERFREAWNENEVGFHILEKIRDIIGIIVQHIRNAADATVEWSAQLDFYPLLDAVDRFLESIKPVVDAVYGVMEDFYTQVLLPLGKWTLEKGLPELLQVFIDFNNKVDWEGLRQSLSELWDHLEPFAETVGEGLILFIERVSDALADFLNSQEFKDFLKSVEDWMDNVTPEDVANTLENVAKAVVGIKLALAGWPAIEGFIGFVGAIGKLIVHAKQAKQIKELADAMKGLQSAGSLTGNATTGTGGEIIQFPGKGAAEEIGETATKVGGLGAALKSAGAFAVDFAISSTAALGVTELIKDKMWEHAEATGAASQAIAEQKELYDGWDGSLKAVWDNVKGLTMGMQGLPTTIASSAGAVDALNKAMEATANGTIYTDEQLQKMQSTWGFTAEDVEMLRQSMLDANPELREIADNFGLVDASAQTLGQIEGSMKLVNDRILETTELSDKMKDFIPVEVTDDAQAFFDAVSDGSVNLETYKTAMENTSGAIQQFSADMVAASTNIGEGLTQGMENTDTDTPATGFFDKLVASIKSVFGIASPAANMNPLGENIILGVIEGFKNNIEQISAPITQLITSITTKFNGAIGTIKSVWSNIWSGLPSIMVNIFNSISNSLSSFVSSIGNKLSGLASSVKNAFSNIGSGVKSAFSGLSSKMTRSISLSVPSVSFNIPQFATGGFPSKASLFWANENGVPELVGQMNGNTAVTSGAEITGIAEAVRNSGKTEAELLSLAVSLLQVIAEKPTIGNGDIFDAAQTEYRSRAKTNGYDTVDPVWG